VAANRRETVETALGPRETFTREDGTLSWGWSLDGELRQSSKRGYRVMDSRRSLGIGVVLTIFGAAGMILAPTLGATALARPWSFAVGFLVGVMTGVGVALTVYGLISRRRAS
jgi:hypothetical protein